MIESDPNASSLMRRALVDEIKLALDENREKLLRLANDISQNIATDASADEELWVLTNQRDALLEKWEVLIEAAVCKRKALLDAAVNAIRKIERLSE